LTYQIINEGLGFCFLVTRGRVDEGLISGRVF
jgi:hypothetical protein